jgi:RNA polymerase sigma factor (sigma-70 family)
LKTRDEEDWQDEADPEPPRSTKTSGVWATVKRILRRGDTAHPASECANVTEIYVRYRQWLWRRLRRPRINEHDAEDILQKVFLTLHLRVQQAGGTIPDNLPLVLATIAGHEICNYLRTERRRANKIDDGADTELAPAGRPDAEQLVHLHRRREIFDAILAELPEKERQLIVLCDVTEMTPAEVGEMLDLSGDAVRVELHRARKKFAHLARRDHQKELGDRK